MLYHRGVFKTKFILSNAVDIEKIQKLADALPVMRMTNRVWLFVPRRLTPKNGIEYAIRAMVLFKERPLLLLAGSGLEKDKLSLG